MITLEALQTLDSIDRKGSFSAAAEELHRVPSAVSYTIQRLEDELGVKLFDRQKQRARLTATGQLVLKQGRKLLIAAENLGLQAKQAESGWEPRIRILVDTILPVTPLFPLIDRFHQEHPSIEVEIIEESLSGSWEAIIDQKTDLAIGLGGDAPADIKTQRLELGSQELVLAAAPNHPAASTNITNSEQLSQYRQVIIKDSARHLAHRNVGLLGGTSNLFVDHYANKEAAILNGLGIGFLPRKRITSFIKSGSLVIVDSDLYRNIDAMQIVWRQENQGKALQWFISTLDQSKPYSQILD